MAQIKRPQKDDDVRELWKIVDECVQYLNALINNCSVNRHGTKDKLTMTTSNATLELDDEGLSVQTVDWCDGTEQSTRRILMSDS